MKKPYPLCYEYVSDPRAGLRVGRTSGGVRLGFMQHASLGRRFLALSIDWGLAYAISGLFKGQSPHEHQLTVLAIFFAEIALMTTLVQSSIGQKLTGLKVVDATTGGFVSPLRILGRSIMICLVLPAVFTKEGRGYHDLLSNTVVISAR